MRGTRSLALIGLALRPVLPGPWRRRVASWAVRRVPELSPLAFPQPSDDPVQSAARRDRGAIHLLRSLQHPTSRSPGPSEELLGFVLGELTRGRQRPGSQLLQDLWVLYELRGKERGFFVEFGACDGVALSNTLYLEREYGWTGLLAEPNPRYHEAMKANRRARFESRCVWDESGQTVKLVDCGELSTVEGCGTADGHAQARESAARIEQIETVGINDMLRHHGVPPAFDFLSIDTEGSEPRILAALDFDTYRPTCIAVEHNHTGTEKEIDAILTRAGYRRVFASVSQWDAWYVRPPGRSCESTSSGPST
ncbi:MAG: FkbM family methyltransferase [Planctomycetota bacterium]